MACPPPAISTGKAGFGHRNSCSLAERKINHGRVKLSLNDGYVATRKPRRFVFCGLGRNSGQRSRYDRIVGGPGASRRGSRPLDRASAQRTPDGAVALHGRTEAAQPPVLTRGGGTRSSAEDGRECVAADGARLRT